MKVIYNKYKKPLLNGDVVISHPHTSLWCKWLLINEKVYYLDGYPSIDVDPDEMSIGINSVEPDNIVPLGNIFEDPSLVCANYFKSKNVENFKLYLSIHENSSS